jgi:hypothetical protein
VRLSIEKLLEKKEGFTELAEDAKNEKVLNLIKGARKITRNIGNHKSIKNNGKLDKLEEKY